MPISKTKLLAKKLGLVKRPGDLGTTKRRRSQLLSYIIVLDFESTCWKDKKGHQEIIEFPAILLDVNTGDIVSEFQQYVQPQEHPILSSFCTKLTGISQSQVDNGVPLSTCLMLFNHWLKDLKTGDKQIVLMEPEKDYQCENDLNLCAFVTWSDWDLEICLHYECKRKNIRKPSFLDQWIDIRYTYKTFYERKPAGLKGALEDLGLLFKGREHSGLDDARNTALLCSRMIKDGCQLKITKSIYQPKVVGLCTKNNIKQDYRDQKVITYPCTTSIEKISMGNEATIKAIETRQSSSKSTTSELSNEMDVPCNDDTFDISPETLLEIDLLVKNEMATTSEHQVTTGKNEMATTSEHQVTTGKNEMVTTSEHLQVTTGNNLISKLRCVSTSCNQYTPSRATIVSHVQPITLLQSATINIDPLKSSTTSSVTHHSPKQLMTPLCTKRDEYCTSTPMTTSCNKKQTTFKTPTSLVYSNSNASSCSTRYSIRNCSERSINNSSKSLFKTPNSAEWIRVKNSSSHCQDLKVTPPFCDCGKRSRRKVTTTPGPNEGQPFFACSKGRRNGCHFFQWEYSSVTGSPMDHDGCKLESEYED